MSFTKFKTYWTEVSPRVACQLAQVNGVSLTQVQVWQFAMKFKGGIL